MSVGVEVSRERVDGPPQDAAAPLSLPLSAAGAAPRLTAIRLESALAGIRHLESLKRRQGALVRAALHGPFAGQGHGQGQVQGGQGCPDSPPCPLGGRDWLYALLVGPHLARQHDSACSTAGSVQLLEQRFCELGLRGEGGPPAAAGSATPPAHPGGGGDTDGGESPTASGGPAKISSPDGVSAESDSRASSGFYELSDAGTGSLSTSCNSVFSDLVPSPCLGSTRGLPSLGPSRGSPAQGSPCLSQTITELQAAASERRPLSTGDLKRLAEEDANGTSTAPDGKVRRSASEHGSVPPPPPLSPPRLTVLDSAKPGAPSAHPAMTPDTRSHVHGTSEDTTERLDGFIRDLIERRGDGRRFKSPGKARPISTTASINGADRHLRHGKAQQSGASSVRGDVALPITKQQQPTAQEATRTAPCDNGAGDDRRPGGSGAAEAVEGSLKEPRAHVADTMKVGCLATPLPPLPPPPPPPPVMMAIPEEQQPPKAEKIVKFAKTSRCREPSGRAEPHVNSEPRTDEGKGGRQAPAKRCRFSEDVEIIRDAGGQRATAAVAATVAGGKACRSQSDNSIVGRHGRRTQPAGEASGRRKDVAATASGVMAAAAAAATTAAPPLTGTPQVQQRQRRLSSHRRWRSTVEICQGAAERGLGLPSPATAAQPQWSGHAAVGQVATSVAAAQRPATVGGQAGGYGTAGRAGVRRASRREAVWLQQQQSATRPFSATMGAARRPMPVMVPVAPAAVVGGGARHGSQRLVESDSEYSAECESLFRTSFGATGSSDDDDDDDDRDEEDTDCDVDDAEDARGGGGGDTVGPADVAEGGGRAEPALTGSTATSSSISSSSFFSSSSSSSSDGPRAGGLVWPTYRQGCGGRPGGGPPGPSGQGPQATAATAAATASAAAAAAAAAAAEGCVPQAQICRIKASHALKKKILRCRSGSLKLMTTV